MANLKGVNIQKGRLGASRLGTADTISGIIISSPVTPKLSHDIPKIIFTLRDAENLGITKKFDNDNNVNVYRHILEFYQNAGEGTELYLMLVAQATTMSDICELKAKRLLPFAKGKIKQLAVAVNPTGVTVTMLNGIPKDVHDAIPKAQGVALWGYDNYMPLQVFLEGYAYAGNSASVVHLREIPNVEATKVSVFIGQDYAYAKTRTGNGRKYADVGTLLGVCSKAKVNENVGNNELFNLTNANNWIEPGLSSHTPNDEVFESLQTLEDKGFLFGVEYAGMAGVRINNDHTCTPVVVDVDNSMNEHTISYGRVMDKAVRGLRAVYLPKIKTDWAVDAKTGKMSPGVVVALEDIGDKVFEDMLKRGEITYGKTHVDKDSDLLVAKELKIKYKVVPKGAIGEINGTINLKTKA